MKIRAVLFILILSTLACLNGNGDSQSSPPPVDAVATSVAATLAASGGSTQSGPIGTQPPANCQPQHPGAQSIQQASAMAIGSAADPNQVKINDFQGIGQGTKTLTGLAWQDTDQAHFAAGLAGGVAQMPAVFHSLSNGDVLKLEQNGTISQLAQSSDFITLVGENGGGKIAYSLNATGTNGWISTLYATPYGNANTAQALITRNQGDGYVIWPLAVHTVNGQIQGVWYTESMYGIGNILWQPFRDLFYFSLSNNQATSYLGTNTIVAGFSPDHTWVAYAPGTGASPGQAQGAVKLKNLVTCQEVTLTFHASSNLGGGWVNFAPDNQMVAWLEASGVSPMEASYRLRVAKIDGTMIVDSPIANLTSLVGGETPNWIIIGGWGLNHLLILQIHMQGYAAPLMVMWAPDPAQPLDPVLGANQSVPNGEGTFMGFIYP